MLGFYTWAENSALGEWMRSYTYAFSLIEVVHILAFTMLLGVVYTMNFRIMGIALRSRPIPEIAKGLSAWTTAGYILTFGTGIMLFASEALKMRENAMWPYKTSFLIGAIIVQFTVVRAMTKPGRAEAYPWIAKLSALVATILWLLTGMAGRTIAFI
jgi:hypothetical protein